MGIVRWCEILNDRKNKRLVGILFEAVFEFVVATSFFFPFLFWLVKIGSVSLNTGQIF